MTNYTQQRNHFTNTKKLKLGESKIIFALSGKQNELKMVMKKKRRSNELPRCRSSWGHLHRYLFLVGWQLVRVWIHIHCWHLCYCRWPSWEWNTQRVPTHPLSHDQQPEGPYFLQPWSIRKMDTLFLKLRIPLALLWDKLRGRLYLYSSQYLLKARRFAFDITKKSSPYTQEKIKVSLFGTRISFEGLVFLFSPRGPVLWENSISVYYGSLFTLSFTLFFKCLLLLQVRSWYASSKISYSISKIWWVSYERENALRKEYSSYYLTPPLLHLWVEVLQHWVYFEQYKR